MFVPWFCLHNILYVSHIISHVLHYTCSMCFLGTRAPDTAGSRGGWHGWAWSTEGQGCLVANSWSYRSQGAPLLVGLALTFSLQWQDVCRYPRIFMNIDLEWVGGVGCSGRRDKHLHAGEAKIIYALPLASRLFFKMITMALKISILSIWLAQHASLWF